MSPENFPTVPGASHEALGNLAEACHSILANVGEDTSREGLIKTPMRMAKALQFLTRGYEEDPRQVLAEAIFEEPTQELVVVRNIEFYSLCEHHVLPFFGRAHIGYIPNGRILGLSKVARLVEVFSRRLQVQERLTQQVAQCLMDTLQPLGVAVVMEANHMCMMMRGVEKQNSSTVTSSLRGVLADNPSTRAEFMGLIRGT
jgi:GTP cyclohydrolase IA